jgi:putative ABC transport system permease protein
MRNQDLGVDINQTLVLKGPGVVYDSLFQQSLEGMKADAMRIPGIKKMAWSSNVPGDEIFWATGIRRLTADATGNISGYTVGMDADYVDAFGLDIIEGRNFDITTQRRKSVILSRAMTVALDFKDPKSAIGEKVIQGRDTLEIIGVLENYHQMSLKEQVTPLVYRYTPHFARFLSFKMETGNSREILAQVEQSWNTHFPGNPMDYFFLDQFFNRQYDSDRAWLKYEALRGRVRSVWIKKLKVVSGLSTLGKPVVIYYDNLNAVFNEEDLITNSDAVNIALAYHQKRLLDAQKALECA